MKESKTKENMQETKLLAVIRIAGMVKVRKDMAETLSRLRLRRKYACTIVNGNDPAVKGMLAKIKFYVAYGEIDDATLTKLIEARGESNLGRKQKQKTAVKDVVKGLHEGKSFEDLGLKGFFRLAPPRGGIDSKLQYPKGVLGNNKTDITKLLGKML